MKTREERELLTETVTKLVASALPVEFIHAAIEEGVRAYVADFKVDDYRVKEILKEVIQERTRELLRTTYADQVDAIANQAAAAVFAKRDR